MKRMVPLLVWVGAPGTVRATPHLGDERGMAESTWRQRVCRFRRTTSIGAEPAALLRGAAAAVREDLPLLVVGRGAPAHDLCERAATSHADVVVIETTRA